MKTNISLEYTNQKTWRNWNKYIEKIPISNSDSILDIGCGTGDVSLLLSEKAQKITAIDRIDELIKFANHYNSSPNIEYICGDISNFSDIEFELFDGIWSSFGVAYFTNLENTFKKWASLLKPGGWIAIAEVNNMFGHEPMSEKSKKIIQSYYKNQKNNGTYNFLCGQELELQIKNAGFEVVSNTKMKDRELVFDGIASKEIIKAWENRLSRMNALQKFMGKADFAIFKNEFINSLKHEQHKCKAEIIFVVAKKITKYNISYR